MAHQFEVERVTANAIVACVIDLFLPRNVSVEVGKHDDVNGSGTAVYRDTTIAAASTGPAMGTLPFPASGNRVDNDTLKDALENGRSTASFHFCDRLLLSSV